MRKTNSNPVKEICVVHLVRYKNDLELFRNFLDSYKNNTGAIDHDLFILFKGFENSEDLTEYIVLLENIPHFTFNVTDEGYDITAYISFTRQYANEYQYFCFLNSNSIILDDEWLVKLYNQLALDDVGMVGATGSWQSHKGASSLFWLIMTAIYYSITSLFERKKNTNKLQEFAEVYQYLKYLVQFDSFPNAHIRTTAFMIHSREMLVFSNHNINTKFDAYIFESGKQGLSSSIRKANLKILMVGRDAKGYEEHEWDKSNIYMCSEQENLLVADNVTKQYQHGTQKFRKYLSNMAWNQHDFLADKDHWRAIANRKKYKEKIQRQKLKLKSLDSEHCEDPAKIIIFGAGILGKYFSKWLKENTSNIVIVGFVDSNVVTTASIHKPIYLVERIDTYEYILISSNRFYEEIIDELIVMEVDLDNVI